MIEDYLQAQCYQWFHNEYTRKNEALLFHVPNGGLRNKKEAMKLKAIGVVPGIPDLIMLRPLRSIYFELKTKKGNRSPHQVEIHNLITSFGFDVHLIRDFESFKTIVEAEMNQL